RERRRRRSAAASDDRRRTVPARPRARGVPQAVRRAKDARADPIHVEDRKAVEELMQIVERGSGHPLVLIPGLQGRWEFQRATVAALAAALRVITFSLDAAALDGYAQQAVDAMSRAGVERATLCGISFGGLIALRCASRDPSRCDKLVLASTPPPALR